MKKYIVEALGTFSLALAVGLAGVSFPVMTPVLAALVVGLFVYTTAHVSGAHFNPAVTIGAWSIKKISPTEAVSYIVSQFIGASIALLLVSQLVEVPAMSIGESTLIGLAELLGTFFLTFGIASVIYGKTQHAASGLVVGGSLLLGVTFSTLLGASGILNPAVAFSLHSFGLMYVLGPVIGGILGMQAYKHLGN